MKIKGSQTVTNTITIDVSVETILSTLREALWAKVGIPMSVKLCDISISEKGEMLQDIEYCGGSHTSFCKEILFNSPSPKQLKAVEMMKVLYSLIENAD